MIVFLIVLGGSVLGALAALFRRFYMPAEEAIKTPSLEEKPVNEPIPIPAPIVQPEPVQTPTEPPELLWDTQANIKHSIRLICDEEGLDLEQKNTMCATIGAESIWYNTKAINHNYIIKNGVRVIASTDYGLCQWNDYYHGKEISPDEALNNPEKAVRLMCKYWKRGQRTLWIAYKNGSYKRYL